MSVLISMGLVPCGPCAIVPYFFSWVFRGSKVFSPGCFVGLNFFLVDLKFFFVGISWFQIFFSSMFYRYLVNT